MKEMLRPDLIILAMKKAGKDKRKKNRRHAKLREYREHSEKYISFFINYILTYYPIIHNLIEINDGISAKKRRITVPTAEEVVLHNLIVIVTKPIFETKLYEHSYACLEGKGIHQAKKVIAKWIRTDIKYCKYCCQMDIRQFFESVDQECLIKMFSSIFRDKQFMQIIKYVIHTVPNGIALGYTTSHWFANILLTKLDRYIKEVLKVPHYIRFVDDLVLFDSNKRRLHKARWAITNWLKDNLNLQIKDNWQVFLFADITPKHKKEPIVKTVKIKNSKYSCIHSIKWFLKTKSQHKQNNSTKSFKVSQIRPLDFLGFKFYKNKVTLRKKVAKRIRRKALHIFKKKGKATIKDARQMIVYAGICKYADCFQWFKKYVLKYISIKKLRKKISEYDKRNI